MAARVSKRIRLFVQIVVLYGERENRAQQFKRTIDAFNRARCGVFLFEQNKFAVLLFDFRAHRQSRKLALEVLQVNELDRCQLTRSKKIANLRKPRARSGQLASSCDLLLSDILCFDQFALRVFEADVVNRDLTRRRSDAAVERANSLLQFARRCDFRFRANLIMPLNLKRLPNN